MLFGHCSEIIGQENWSGSLDTAFITKENERNSRFLCCHGQNIEESMGKIDFVELCDFDTSTEKEVNEGHLRPAFAECFIGVWLVDGLGGGDFVQWDYSFRAHCCVIELVIFTGQIVSPLTSGYGLHLISCNSVHVMLFPPQTVWYWSVAWCVLVVWCPFLITA